MEESKNDPKISPDQAEDFSVEEEESEYTTEEEGSSCDKKDVDLITDQRPSADLEVAKEKELREVTLPDGNIYKGQWLQNLPHGEGKLSYKTGGSYQGEFSQGNPHGQGIRTHPDGRKYTGSFVHGRAEGYGELQHNSAIYKGFWKNDAKHGEKSDEIWPDGTTYQGGYRGSFILKQYKLIIIINN